MRLRRAQPALSRFLDRVDVIREWHRTVHASVDPVEVAGALAARAGAWLPAPGWAVVGGATSTSPALLATCGLAPELERVACGVGAWVVECSRAFETASLRDDTRVENAPHVAAIAVPVGARGRTVAALVGVDRRPSAAVPHFAPQLLAALGAFVEPAAVALDNAERLWRAETRFETDDLTQLRNVRYLERVLRAPDSQHRRPLSLLFIDLDGFKMLNDRYGHPLGSRALVEAAGIISACAPGADAAVRFGGDEFALVLPDTGCEAARALARCVCERLREHVFLQDAGIRHRLTASIGVATLADAGTAPGKLIQAADAAMYRVKANGKDGVGVADAVLREEGPA